MARTRNIKPGLAENEVLAELGPHAQLLFALLPCHADKEGRLEDRPKRLKAKIFPYYEVDVDGLLDQLANCPERFIIRYEVEGQRYIQITNFHAHQKPHHMEAESEIPGANDSRAVIEPCTNREQADHDPSTPRAPIKVKDKAIEVKANGGGAGGVPEPETPKPNASELAERFLAAWNSTEGVRRARCMSGKRLTAFKARLKDRVDGEEWLSTALAVLASKFPLRCTRGSPDAWQPDLEWFLRPDSVLKVLEGKYDFEKFNGTEKPNQSNTQRLNAILDGMQ